jgi:hypothetical protein
MNRTCIAVLTVIVFAVLLGAVRLAGVEPTQSARPRPVLTGGLNLIAGNSTFPVDCNGQQVGTNFRDSVVEPSVASNPQNPSHLVGVWQQDRWSTGGSSGVLAAVSMDLGRSWTPSVAHFSICTGGSYQRVTDPWVTIAPDGTVYQSVLALNNSSTTTAIEVSRSSNQGYTWDRPISLILHTPGSDDKPTVAADANDANYVYVVWTGTALASGDQPAFLSRTTNSGKFWENPRIIYDPGPSSQAYNNLISVLPDHTLADVFIWNTFRVNGKSSYAIVRSTDRGLTWSSPVVVAIPQTAGVINNQGTPANVRAGGPSVAVDPASGAIYVAWEDGRFSGLQRDGIALSKSTDGGITWSVPVQVNQVPQVAAFTPAVAVSQNGTVALTYYDFRNDTSGHPNTLPTSYWRITSTDGGQSWQEVPLAGPFDLTTAPIEDGAGYFVGDYEGLAASGNSFLAFFVTTNGAKFSSSLFSTASEHSGVPRSNGQGRN